MLITIQEATEVFKLNEREVADIENVVTGESRDYVMPFGKWKGKHLYEVPAEYVEWMVNSDYFKKQPALSALSKHLTNYAFPVVVTTSTLKQWFGSRTEMITKLEKEYYPISDTLLGFGKYKDMTLMNVADYDVQYLIWLISKEETTLNEDEKKFIKSVK